MKPLVLAELYAGVQISNKEVAVKSKLSNIMLKTRFPFIYASISRDTKTLTIASIRCLASQQIFRLSIFAAGLFFVCGNFARCVVLLNAPLSNRDEKKLLLRFTLPAKSWSSVSDARRSHHPIGGEIISWRGASCLRTFYTDELKSRVWFGDEYIRFERIYRVYKFDQFSSNFVKIPKNNNKRKHQEILIFEIFVP